jgi:hypothetical protein
MFIGHFAPALVAATHKDAPSLPVLFIGAQLVDWAFFGFVLLGIEQFRLVPGFSEVSSMDLFHMPYTHSLVGSAAFAAGFGALLFAITRNRMTAIIGAAVVLSHWFLDLLVHMPDLTIAGGEPKLGFGLWDHAIIVMPLELGITLAALHIYAMKTGGWRGPVAGLGAILLALQATDWLGEKPAEVGPSMIFLGWFAFGVATLAAWWAARGQKSSRLAHFPLDR